jgi:hypothetical protein
MWESYLARNRGITLEDSHAGVVGLVMIDGLGLFAGKEMVTKVVNDGVARFARMDPMWG